LKARGSLRIAFEQGANLAESGNPLNNQVAIVTGARAASAGDRADARCSRRHRHRTARDEARLAAVAEESRAAGVPGRVVPKTLDVADRAAIEPFIEGVIAEFQKIDILVNNAGITRDGLVMNMETTSSTMF